MINQACIKRAHDQSRHGRLQQHTKYCHETVSHCNYHENSGNCEKYLQNLAPGTFE